MKKDQKKTPSDYPQIAFRLSSEEERNHLNSLIDEIQEAYNANRKEGEKMIRRNDVIIEALEKGLKIIRKNLNL